MYALLIIIKAGYLKSRIGCRNVFWKIMKTLELHSSEEEFYKGKSYREAAITSLPEMIVLTWLEVQGLSTLQN